MFSTYQRKLFTVLINLEAIEVALPVPEDKETKKPKT